MSLTVWVLVFQEPLRHQISRALKPLGPGRVVLVFIRSRRSAETLLYHLSKDPVSRFPDLLVAETGPGRDDGTDLLKHLRAIRSLDYLPLITEPSLSQILRARQYGACDLLILPLQEKRLLESIRRLIRSREYLRDRTAFSQNTVDTWLRLLAPEQQSSTIPDLKDPGRLEQLRKLRRLVDMHPEGLRADEAAKLADISATTARTYLEDLCRLGVVLRRSRHEKRRGRPAILYYPERKDP